jgi:hypothetical protein
MVSLDNIEAGHYIDIEAIVPKFPSLRSLEVGFVFPRRLYIREDNAHLWMKSAALQGMLYRILQMTPKHVSLSWWDDSGGPGGIEGWNDEYWQSVFIPSKVLEDTAMMFQPQRSCLCER